MHVKADAWQASGNADDRFESTTSGAVRLTPPKHRSSLQIDGPGRLVEHELAEACADAHGPQRAAVGWCLLHD